MWRVRDCQFMCKYLWGGHIFKTKEEIIYVLTEYHDIDYTGVKDNDEPYESFFERIAEFKTEEEKLNHLLYYGEWELEKAICEECGKANLKVKNIKHKQAITCKDCGFKEIV